MMTIQSTLRLAVTNLWLNWFRSFLTVIGMVFGSGAVIATLSSNEGARQFIAKQLDSLGTNLLTVNTTSGPVLQTIDRDFVVRYSDLFSGLGLVLDVGNKDVRSGSIVNNSRVFGVEPGYFDALRLKLARGRTFVHEELEEQRPVVVIGSAIRKAFFQDRGGLGQFITLYLGAEPPVPYAVEVIGVLKEKGSAGTNANYDNGIFLPQSLAAKLFGTNVRSVLLGTLKDDDESSVARLQVKSLLAGKFGKALEVTDSREAIETTKNIWDKQNLVGICLAIISLITGGVGIMNVMLLSIHQRKREIGLRKALGARDWDICLQFLLESIVICILGGVMGVFAGWVFGKQVAKMLGQWEAVTNWWTIAMALAFAALTGLVFGLIPALRASRLDPYDALRS